jgi:sulfur-carrier protein
MKVNFYATLRDIVGGRTIEIDLPKGSSVRQLLDGLITCYPQLESKLLDEDDELYRHVHLIVNGRDVPYLEDQMDTILQSDDIVSIFPAVGGGNE